MKKLILLTMLLIMSSIVVADNYTYKEINIIPTCVGDVTVKVENHNNATDYTINACTKQSNELWKCGCNPSSNTSVYLKTNNDLTYSLDIITEYYINKTNNTFNNQTTDDDLKYKRTEQFNDIKIGIVEKPPEPIDPPTKEDYIFFIVLICVFLIVLVLAGVFFIKWLMTDNESDCDFTNTFRNKPKQPTEEVKQIKTTTNESDEIQDILDSL